mmetsp:Transcript_11430/g.10087  ORF Transcript_11430/g.10087 Transcript_11430/m.10087 type:complete len:131 (-) Transcript_11430:223-615(-)
MNLNVNFKSPLLSQVFSVNKSGKRKMATSKGAQLDHQKILTSTFAPVRKVHLLDEQEKSKTCKSEVGSRSSKEDEISNNTFELQAQDSDSMVDKVKKEYKRTPYLKSVKKPELKNSQMIQSYCHNPFKEN